MRSVCDALQMNAAALSSIRGAVPPSRNNLRHANRIRSADMAEALYWSMMKHLMDTVPGFAKGKVRRGYLRRFSRTIHAMDSTTIQLTDLLGYSANAVRWQVWMGLLVHLLMRCLAFMHGWEHSFKRLFTGVRASLWHRWDLPSLLESYGTAKPPGRIRGAPEHASLPGFG